MKYRRNEWMRVSLLNEKVEKKKQSKPGSDRYEEGRWRKEI